MPIESLFCVNTSSVTATIDRADDKIDSTPRRGMSKVKLPIDKLSL